MIDFQNSIIAGKFKVHRCLGAGGMGAVYLASHLMYEDFRVAIKILYPGFLKTEGTRERFKKEITALYAINHPNIVRAFDYFCDEQVVGYSMEYVEGEDLLTKAQKKALEDNEATLIMQKICLGLEAIHNAGILHRDLKPENILISNSGDVKISDFGVADLPDSETLTQQGEVVGTPRYIAPETFLLGKYDQRSDLYSLGIIACEILAGESPFKSTSKVDLLRERLSFRARNVAGFLEHCNEFLVKIVQKLVEIDPEKRYQSAREVREDLERLLNGEEDKINIVRSKTGLFERIASVAGIAPYCYDKLTRSNNYHQSFLAIILTFVLGCGIAMVAPSKLFGKSGMSVISGNESDATSSDDGGLVDYLRKRLRNNIKPQKLVPCDPQEVEDADKESQLYKDEEQELLGLSEGAVIEREQNEDSNSNSETDTEDFSEKLDPNTLESLPKVPFNLEEDEGRNTSKEDTDLIFA